ncbi:hypothetical protein KYI13_12495 (plasmid) [Macrococcoides bohemicum]|nr:hypothetical protein [Macrococcus bohemicus]QYA46105.1 hypothetical protein KYI13_12495 [Macrococcus bohemicus]
MSYLLVLIILLAVSLTMIVEIKISPDRRNLSELRKVWSRCQQRGHMH